MPEFSPSEQDAPTKTMRGKNNELWTNWKSKGCHRNSHKLF